MNQYPWAVNKLKLERAVKAKSSEGDEAIKAHYIAIGGLVNEKESERKVMPESTDSIDESFDEEEKPKRGRKPKEL